MARPDLLAPGATRSSASACLFFLAVLAFALGGCGVEGQLPGLTGGEGGQGGQGQGGQGQGGSVGAGPVLCVEGDTRECHFELPSQGMVINCFNGVETCKGGMWSPCGNGTISSMSSPRVEPNDEARDSADPNSEEPHQNHPDSLSNPAMCNPITSCAHDWCSVGAPLAAACDNCVASICAVSPACCAGAWDASCVAKVDSVCKLSCFRDPCNPSCQDFNEKPINGVVLPGMMIPPWDSGSIDSIASTAAWLAKGKKEPCGDASDCQFNTYCNLPVTNGSIHDKCAVGAPLKDTGGADVCVDKICSEKKECCEVSPGLFCSHNRCSVGAPLFCLDWCAVAVCLFSDPSCCLTGWTQSCVDKVTSVCGMSCTNGWDDTCVDKVHSTCGALCSTPPAAGPPAGCLHDKCYTGAKLAAGCSDPCVGQICAAFPNCCNVAWDATCTAAVSSICSQTCPVKGTCTNWLGGQTDPLCANKPDLTLGVPCNSKIPICNVGGVAAVGTAANPIRVGVAPGLSGQMPACAEHPSSKACPPFIGTIAPGQCVDLDCPAFADGMGEEIIVNGNGAITECNSTPGAASCNGINTNNWTISGSMTTCEPPICTGSKASNSISAMNMHIMVERSTNSGPAAKWTGILNGVANYLQNASNTGGPKAAVQFFPDGPPEATPPATATSCTSAACIAAQPSSQCAVRISPAAGNFTLKNLPWTNVPTTFLTNLKAVALGADVAPTTFAYDGALNNIVAKSPGGYAGDRNIVLVLTGDITTCGGTIASLAGQANSAFVNKRTRTWVIGVGTLPGLFNPIAVAGGTGAAFTVASGDAAGLTAALNTIQSTYLPCSFPLPPVALFDPGNPKVELRGSMANAPPLATMAQVPGLAGCSPVAPPAPFQFYYDNNAAPANIVLCPATCSHLRNFNDVTIKAIKITLNCPGTFDDNTNYVQTYTSKCPLGTKVQWGFLTYDSIEPPGTSTDIKVRTSDNIADFAAAPGPPFVALGTATLGPPDTQKCLLVGGPAMCSIDLFNKLGGLPAAGYDNLELTFKMHSNVSHSQTPTMNGWQITYSCLDSN